MMRPLPRLSSAVDRPVVHVVADRRLAEEDAAVGRDVEVVGQAQARVVDDREPGAIGLVGQLLTARSRSMR
jgi:hypothetical protein